MKWIIVLTLWAAIGYCNYHMVLGNFSHEFPYQDNTDVARLSVIFPPMAIPAYLETPWRWQDKPYTCEQRWEFFRQEYNNLDKEYFNRRNNCDLPVR